MVNDARKRVRALQCFFRIQGHNRRRGDSMKLSIVISMGGALALGAWAAETKVKMADLPPAVPAAGQGKTKKTALFGLAQGAEKGKNRLGADSRPTADTRAAALHAPTHTLSA